MLSFLMNRRNTIGEHIVEEITTFLPNGIGITDDLPVELQNRIAEAVPIELYGSGCLIGSEEMRLSLLRAISLHAKRFMIEVGHFCDRGNNEKEIEDTVKQLSECCKENNIRLLLTNRRNFIHDVPVCSEKLIRLSENSDAGVAFDIGASHASQHALEDFYDYLPVMEAVLLNDNFGRGALYPIGHPNYDPSITPDDMRQPGYGTAPFVKIAEEMAAMNLNLPLFINGSRYMNASMETVLLETKVLLSGKVYINPAGGKIGMDRHTGRILI